MRGAGSTTASASRRLAAVNDLLRGLAAGLFALGTAVGSARAQSVFDDVDECDLLAAHPADPERLADGVADGALVPRLAVKACEAAAKQNPNELRFAYQLGRAYLAANRKDNAAEQFKRAADGNYAAAFAAQAEMGVDSVNGLNLSELITSPASIHTAEDTLKALTALHAKAVQGGFMPSQQRAEALTFDASLYTQEIVGQISKGDFEAARTASQKPDVRAYLYTLATNLMGQCGPVLDAKTVARLASYRFGGAITAEQEEAPAVAIQPLVGEIDAHRFVRRHGCDGPVPQVILFLPLALYLEKP
jgi:hypothetical protein